MTVDWSDATDDEKHAELAAMVAEGLTQTTMAGCLGLSKERVRQLLTSYDLLDTWRKNREQVSRDKKRSAHAAATMAFLAEGHTGDPQVRKQLAHLADVPPRSKGSKWSPEEILDCLRMAAPGGQVLTGPAYDEYRRTQRFPDGRPWPSSQQSILKFGTWRNACHAAGVKAKVAVRKSYTRRWNDDDIHKVLVQFASEALGEGKNPTVWGYDQWSKRKRAELLDVPSLATIRHYNTDMVAVFNEVRAKARADLAMDTYAHQ